MVGASSQSSGASSPGSAGLSMSHASAPSSPSPSLRSPNVGSVRTPVVFSAILASRTDEPHATASANVSKYNQQIQLENHCTQQRKAVWRITKSFVWSVPLAFNSLLILY